MNEPMIFKGGSMNGTEITCTRGVHSMDGDEVIIQNFSASWACTAKEVYIFVEALNSWVYDHKHEGKTVEDE